MSVARKQRSKKDPAMRNQFSFETFITDSPLNNPSQDRFNRWKFAQRIGQTIVARSDPSSIVIGLYGAWGEGKTTSLNFIEQELLQHQDMIVVKFNPWQSSDQNDLTYNFFLTLAESIGKALPHQAELIRQILMDYAVMLSPLAFGREQNQTRTGHNPFDSKNELKARFENLLETEKRRVTIFIDDIDRLEKAEIQAIFRVVKLSADFAHTVYIIAFDEEMVASALGRDPNNPYLNAGRHFLEKIVQIPLHLPLADRVALRNYCLEAIAEALNTTDIALSETQWQVFINNFVDGLEISLQTPRMAKRYANALTFTLPILKGEVNPVDLMLVEGLRILYPTLYEVVRDHPNLFLSLQVNKESSSDLQRGLVGLNKEEENAAKQILKFLFPRLFNNGYGQEWEEIWAREQRVASAKYFSRYFSYAISEGDVSDHEIESFLNNIPHLSQAEISKKLHQLINPLSAETLILKIQIRELPAHTCASLSQALACVGELFPKNDSLFPPFVQACRLVAKLAARIPDLQHFTVWQQIVQQGQPLDFVVECYRWMRTDDQPTDTVLTSAEGSMLDNIVATRIEQFAANKILYVEHAKDAPFLLGIWAKLSSRATTADYLVWTFQQDARNVVKLLTCYMRKELDFTRNHYTALSHIIDPSIIFNFLQHLFPTELTVPKYQPYVNNPQDQTLAKQFAYIHAVVQKEGLY